MMSMLSDLPVEMDLVARAIDISVLLCDATGRIEWVNDVFTRTTGFELADVEGRRRTEVMRGPFTRTDEFQRLAEDLRAGRELDVEYMSLTKQGRPLWSELRLRPVVDAQGRTRLIGTERDITARRQAQEKARVALRRTESLANALRHEKRLLASVLGTIPVSVWWKNTDLRFVGCNEAYLDGRGLTSQAEVVGRLERQLETRDAITAVTGEGAAALPSGLSPADVVEELERWVLATCEPSPPLHVTVTVAGGTEHEGTIVVMPHFGPDGELEGVIGVGADVTHVTELERALARASRPEPVDERPVGIANERMRAAS
jgi:PAS domain S-box-containing protein